MPTDKLFTLLAAVNGFVAVALGAFGSHGLRARLSERMLEVWQTAVQYHFIHTLVLLAVGVLLARSQSTWLNVSGWVFTAGIVFFSGSLYWLALGGPKWLGPITPIGGLCFMLGWLSLAIAALKSPTNGI